MKVCSRAINFLQIMNAEGDVRICSWRRNNIIGNLLKQDMSEILHGEKAEAIRKSLSEGDYSHCDKDNCPYLANGKMEEILIDIETIPDYPTELHLGYEGVCNYSCTCCSSHQHMEDTRNHNYNIQYEELEKRLEKIMPHVRTLAANGRGELFASKRILKLLQTWKPLAPAEEIQVVLETNGSMFDEMHWKQIENLGQYHLSVEITVMSFNERIYQHLSGTKLPIKKIEDNLLFVKGLREKGIINRFELATVLQEENFREMPEFTRRCIEEFGADRVRIRPIFPGGIYNKHIQWFMDVRNTEHPYYLQYKEIMKHPIFQDPKVLLWSGDMSSSLGQHPGVKAEHIQRAVELILSDSKIIEKLDKNRNETCSDMFLYGIGTLGKIMIRLYQKQLQFKIIFDEFTYLKKWEDIPVKRPDCVFGLSGTILVTTYGQFDFISQKLKKAGFWGNVICVYDLLEEEIKCGKS